MTACCKPHKKLHKILRKKFNLESKVPSREEKFFTKTQRILRTARFARFYNACPKITLKMTEYHKILILPGVAEPGVQGAHPIFSSFL